MSCMRNHLSLENFFSSNQGPNSLQHQCRKFIIILLIQRVGINKVIKTCKQLPLPRILLNHLTDIKTFGYDSGFCCLHDGDLITFIDLRRQFGQIRADALVIKDKWMKVKHENISSIITCFEESNMIVSVFEPSLPSLRDIINYYKKIDENIPEMCIWKIVNQLCSALLYLRKHQINHPKLTSKTISITTTWNVQVQNLLMHWAINEDFELDIQYGIYAAPETIEGRLPKDKQNTWFIGCIAYELVHKEHAFQAYQGSSLFDILNHIVEGHPPPKIYLCNGYSSQLISFIQTCLTCMYCDRPTLEQVYRMTANYIDNKV